MVARVNGHVHCQTGPAWFEENHSLFNWKFRFDGLPCIGMIEDQSGANGRAILMNVRPIPVQIDRDGAFKTGR